MSHWSQNCDVIDNVTQHCSTMKQQSDSIYIIAFPYIIYEPLNHDFRYKSLSWLNKKVCGLSLQA